MKEHAIKIVWQAPNQCEQCGIRHLVLFADLNKEDFYKIHHPVQEMEFAAGDFLYRQDDDPHYVYTIRSGLVKLVTYLKDGNQRIVRLLKQGDLAGIEALGDLPYEHHAIILEPVSVCRIPVNVVKELGEETPRLNKQLTVRWHRSIKEADFWLTELSTGTARSRVTQLLLFLKSITDESDFFLPGREDMGAMLGITTETSSRIISELKQKGILRLTGSHRAEVDSEQLNQFSDKT